MTNVHSGPSDLTEAILRPAPPPSLTDSSFSRTNGDIIAMQFSAEAGVMPDGGDGGGEAAAAWDGGGYSIGRLATPFTGIDNLAVVKERLETHLDMTISKWKGKWPLAERVWVKRQVEKLVFSMNQFLEDEIDDVTATTIRTTVVRPTPTPRLKGPAVLLGARCIRLC